MTPLLFLSHRIPYPPDKGDKIRSYHVLKTLVEHFDVHLGAFVDLDADWRHEGRLREMVAGLTLRPLPHRQATLRSASGMLTGEPLSLPFYRDAELSRWVADTLKDRRIDVAYVFSSPMGQYLPVQRLGLEVVDFCDVDSDKWKRYAATKPWPLSWVYARESKALAEYERSLAARCDWSLFVSESEARMFTSAWPELERKALAIRNGVDTVFFDPEAAYERRCPDAPTVAFTGAMDYWANIDAVLWFAAEVWPHIRTGVEDARFQIVGSRPDLAVRRLHGQRGIEVTGTVPDVRPYLAAARAIVAPLRIARGIQNKVLEALAMARPVVATAAAVNGLDGMPVPGVRIAESPERLADAVRQLLRAETPVSNAEGRRFVLQHFAWPTALRPLVELLGKATCTASAGRRGGCDSGLAAG